jgi:hypothetical protein
VLPLRRRAGNWSREKGEFYFSFEDPSGGLFLLCAVNILNNIRKIKMKWVERGSNLLKIIDTVSDRASFQLRFI